MAEARAEQIPEAGGQLQLHQSLSQLHLSNLIQFPSRGGGGGEWASSCRSQGEKPICRGHQSGLR
eukprot:233375-Rhodomonas_salina.1